MASLRFVFCISEPSSFTCWNEDFDKSFPAKLMLFNIAKSKLLFTSSESGNLLSDRIVYLKSALVCVTGLKSIPERSVLKRIESNIKNLIKDEKFYSLGAYSIRDLLVLNNKILFSFTKELSNNCYNTSIMISDFNLNYLKFTEFFSYKDCLSKKTNKGFSPVSSGGRMVSFKNGKILLTIGSFSRYGPDAIIISGGHRKHTVK